MQFLSRVPGELVTFGTVHRETGVLVSGIGVEDGSRGGGYVIFRLSGIDVP